MGFVLVEGRWMQCLGSGEASLSWERRGFIVQLLTWRCWSAQGWRVGPREREVVSSGLVVAVWWPGGAWTVVGNLDGGADSLGMKAGLSLGLVLAQSYYDLKLYKIAYQIFVMFVKPAKRLSYTFSVTILLYWLLKLVFKLFVDLWWWIRRHLHPCAGA